MNTYPAMCNSIFTSYNLAVNSPWLFCYIWIDRRDVFSVSKIIIREARTGCYSYREGVLILVAVRRRPL